MTGATPSPGQPPADPKAVDRNAADWIAVDWGTSNLRVWAMDAAGRVLAEASSDRGMGSLTPDAFSGVLAALIAPWRGAAGIAGPATVAGDLPVIICGMAGARQGWTEAPYRAVPCTPLDARAATLAPDAPSGCSVRILPGLSQARPADVMRGEETQIAGFLSLNPGFDGVLCLPGTHNKWVQVSAGEVISFRTFMTGELFALLADQSVLRHGLQGQGWDEGAFAEAVGDALARPEAMAARLFGLRAESLLHAMPPATGRARLSGLLIGAELAAARPYWLGQAVAVVGSGAVAASYVTALTAQGLKPVVADGAAMTRAGLTAARHQLKDRP